MEIAHNREEKLFGKDFLLVCASNMLAFFSLYMIIPVLPVFLEERGYSNSLIGALMSMATVAALLRPAFGRLADRGGRKTVLAWGTLLLGLSTFLYTAFSTAVPLFLIRFLNGFGLAAYHTAAYAMVGDLAPRSRRLQAIAFFYISVDVTIALAPILAEALVDARGYTFLYLLAGGIASTSFLCSLMVRETIPASRKEERPARRGLTPLHRAVYLGTMGFTLTFGALQTFIVLSSQKNGIARGELFFTVFAVTLIFFRLAVGRKADRIPRDLLILASGAVTLAGLATLAFAPSLAVLVLGSLLYALGFAYLPTTMSALLLDHTPEESRGLALGLFMAVFDTGVGLGGLALGPLADGLGYPAMYLASGALALVCLLYFLLVSMSIRSAAHRGKPSR